MISHHSAKHTHIHTLKSVWKHTVVLKASSEFVLTVRNIHISFPLKVPELMHTADC